MENSPNQLPLPNSLLAKTQEQSSLRASSLAPATKARPGSTYIQNP